MKQHITEEQLKELNKKQLKKLEDWFEPDIDPKHRWGVNSLELNIGQMIEFLEDKTTFKIIAGNQEYTIYLFPMNEYSNKELCDALWEAIKGVLNED